jgi:hypothetical protein
MFGDIFSLVSELVIQGDRVKVRREHSGEGELH